MWEAEGGEGQERDALLLICIVVVCICSLLMTAFDFLPFYFCRMSIFLQSCMGTCLLLIP